MTERRILEVYAGVIGRSPAPGATGTVDTVEIFRVVTYCERDDVKAFGKYVPCSLQLIGDTANLEMALDLAVMATQIAPEFDEVRFTGLELST